MLLHILSYALLFSPQLLAAGLEDIPIEVFENSIATWLQPGTIARLGRASRTSHYLSEGGLSRYKKGDAYDLELLYAEYHSADDDYERDAVRRLIEANLPEKIPASYVIQSKYELCKKELFTGDHMNYSCISDAFPEVSLMLLKHKRFIYDPRMNVKARCSPVLIDAFVGSLRKINNASLSEMFKYADPRKLGPAFSVLHDPETPELHDIIKTGDLLSLLDTNPRAISMLYLITQATEENMELVLEYLSRFDGTDMFLPFLKNFMKYEHMSPVTKAVIKNYRFHGIISERPEILNSIDTGHFKDYYPVIKGESFVENALKYLGSFSEGNFEMEKSEDVCWRDLAETAIVHEFPETLLSALVNEKGFSPDLSLVIFALKHGVSSNTMLEIINSNRMNDCEIVVEEIDPITQPIDMQVLKALTSSSVLSVHLLLHMNKLAPRMEYINLFLEDPKLKEAFLDRLATQAFHLEGEAAPEMDLRIIKVCFEEGLNVSWDFQADPSVAVEFLEAQTTDALLGYVKEYNNNPFRNMHGLAMSIIAKRPDGYPIFYEKYFSGPGNSKMALYGTMVLLKARHESLNHDKAASLIATHWTYFFESGKFIEMDENEDTERIYQSMSEEPHSIGLKKFMENYVLRCVERCRSMSSITPIKYITYEKSKFIFNSAFISRLACDVEYYKPRIQSEKFFMNRLK